MNDIIISKQEDVFPAMLARRVSLGDETWIGLMISLGRTWTIKGDMYENRKNVCLSMREYWKGTYEQ